MFQGACPILTVHVSVCFKRFGISLLCKIIAVAIELALSLLSTSYTGGLEKRDWTQVDRHTILVKVISIPLIRIKGYWFLIPSTPINANVTINWNEFISVPCIQPRTSFLVQAHKRKFKSQFLNISS